MQYVFIDTNVYLDFFRFPKDKLKELEKLAAAISGGELKLLTTEQVVHELVRNRHKVVAESIEVIRKLRPAAGAPLMAEELPEYEALARARREFGVAINEITQKLTDQYEKRTLAADVTVDALIDAAENIPITGEIVEAARIRKARGNPPGKKAHHGDEINWEALLGHLPAGSDLCIVTDDSDFRSAMNDAHVNPLLADEWHGKNGGSVLLYSRISSLLAERFPDIDVAADIEKEARVRRLIESGSFARTHEAIEALRPYNLDFTDEQARELLQAALRNSQINWISHDSDVSEFFGGLLDKFRHLLEEGDHRVIKEGYVDPPPWELPASADDDLPF